MLKHDLRLLQSSALHHNESLGAKGQHSRSFHSERTLVELCTVTTCTAFTVFGQSTVRNPRRPKCGVGRGLEA